MSNTTPKKYPVSTPEVASLFKLDKSHGEETAHTEHSEAVDHHGALPVHNLPVAEHHEEKHAPVEHGPAHVPGSIVHTQTNTFGGMKVLKTAAPYLVLFGVGVVIYYFFFSNINISGLFRPSTEKVLSQKDTLVESLKKQQSKEYSEWISTFYFDVSDPKVLDPDADNSGNGLSNFHKYLLNLNPKSYDTLGLGISDTQALAQGINPLSGNPLTQDQKDVLEKYFDMEIIMNRFTVAHMQQSGVVAGSNVVNTSSGVNVNGAEVDPNAVDIDLNVPGRLEIPSLGVNVPIIWTSDTKNFDRDLQSGVVHYPGTALPSQIGTTYISGHSSNVPWAKGSYNKIFEKLGSLPENASFKITVVQKNGKDARLHYIVTRKHEYLPTDQAQFENSGKSVVALSTCWPVGSTARRMVAFGDLVQVEKDR